MSALTKRTFDLSLLLLVVPIILPIALVVAIMIKLSAKGDVLFWSDRIGIDNRIFSMPKFRSMKIDTPLVATHLLKSNNLISIGAFLRKSSLDELPQLWCIFKGDMSFVGPRPALFNQYNLISLRTKYGIDKILPGLTGLAQINGRDNLSIIEKVEFDVKYKKLQSLLFDVKILIKTFYKVLTSRHISK